MTCWRVHLKGYADASITVYAEGSKQARDEAEREISVSLCHDCASAITLGDDWEAVEAELIEE